MSDMTSAVAIDLLDNLIGMFDDNQENDYDSALHMAINALKAQSDGNTISRQDAIDAVSNMLFRKFGICGDLAEITLAGLPSAQPEIIWCKDCKHWLDIDDGRQKHRMCADVYGDWFCADAERRTDERSN